MKRYNIDTTDADLIQFDLKDSWTLSEDDKARFTVVDMENMITSSILLNRYDLEKIKNIINNILGVNTDEITFEK